MESNWSKARRATKVFSVLTVWGIAMYIAGGMWWLAYLVGFAIAVAWEIRTAPLLNEDMTPCDCQRKLQDAEQEDMYEEK